MPNWREPCHVTRQMHWKQIADVIVKPGGSIPWKMRLRNSINFSGGTIQNAEFGR